MPTISSDTIFHFTTKTNLIGILKNEFYPHFSLEHYQINNTSSFKIGIPMVCFCDIPLSLANRHMTKYGNYGIGMSKKWAELNKLNPVLYLKKGSEVNRVLNHVLYSIVNNVKGVRESGIEIESLTEQRDLLVKLFTYTKSFESLKKDNEITKYYDEREWRYVPDISSYNVKRIILTEEEFKDPLLSEENKKLKNAKLRFEPNDINYIIIKEESERSDLIEEISRIKEKYDYGTQQKLLSKILSAERICQDF